MKLYAKILLAAGGAALVVFIVSLFFRGDSFSRAVRQYEKGAYEDSLKKLNRLALTADYESGEMILYYRCRALNALAERLERKYDDELKTITSGDEKDRAEEKRYLEKKLADYNNELEADLALLVQGRTARIVPRGKFYDQFAARYRGSRYLEDLDLEEVYKVRKTEPQRLLNAVSNYYSRYPRTPYLPQLVKLVFDHMKEGVVPLKGSGDFVKKLIADFAARYPTSSEVQRLFQCAGDDVNLRNSPDVEGSLVGKIKRGEILLQLEKSMDTRQVGDTRDYWYRVSTMEGVSGWIFGKFIEPLKVESMEAGTEESWALDERFMEWENSNTPANWMHVPNGDIGALSFTVKGDRRVVKLNAPTGKSAGLFRRFAPGESFTVEARGRFVAGDGVTLLAVALGPGRVYRLVLRSEEIELSGRKIPVHTSDWHDYRLTSEGAGKATLRVDGEIIISRVPPAAGEVLSDRGIYCLCSGEKESSLGELEYIKMK
ncbi:MAG TPA: SH3 domain-containing protein [Spirochaetes bacterium]|nr:SH3 domain-containing protein [Spirochaetota bacterium]